MSADGPTRAVTRYLGGESGHRSFFGGTHSRTRVVLVGFFIACGMILTPLIGWPALLLAALGSGATLLATVKTHRGSIIERHRKRRRWAHRLRTGTDRFRPYDALAWDELHRELRVAGRDGQVVVRGEIAAMRSRPDGADGMGWLEMATGEPGIAWHDPVGETAYLSATFAVSGQIRGIESTAAMTRAATGWGTFLATCAAASSLVSDVQITTRVLPADSAFQEHWALQNLDKSAPNDAIRSYEEVLRLTGANSMVQRHFVTLKWSIDTAFRDTARKHGVGRDGWRQLMRHEVAATTRGLTEAKMGTVNALSARQMAAVILHQQNPSRPIDLVADANPGSVGIASRDEFSAHIVSGVDTLTGNSIEWWHRTAAIKAEALATASRTQLWLLELLIGKDLDFIRSISLHMNLVPAAEAKAAARQDLVRDAAEAISRREAGQIDSDETDAHMTAARRRGQDLVAGSQHHGAAWIGFVTISVRSQDELARASRQLEDTCSTGLGIERLDWMDSFQSAASGTTWPIARGLRAGRSTLSARVYQRLAGQSEEGAI